MFKGGDSDRESIDGKIYENSKDFFKILGNTSKSTLKQKSPRVLKKLSVRLLLLLKLLLSTLEDILYLLTIR